MILAYPYFEQGHIIYYVYYYNKNTQVIKMLSYDTIKDEFITSLKRKVQEDGTVNLDYRPKRTTTHISQLREVEE